MGEKEVFLSLGSWSPSFLQRQPQIQVSRMFFQISSVPVVPHDFWPSGTFLVLMTEGVLCSAGSGPEMSQCAEQPLPQRVTCCGMLPAQRLRWVLSMPRDAGVCTQEHRAQEHSRSTDGRCTIFYGPTFPCARGDCFRTPFSTNGSLTGSFCWWTLSLWPASADKISRMMLVHSGENTWLSAGVSVW